MNAPAAPVIRRIDDAPAVLAELRRAWTEEYAGEAIPDDGFEQRFGEWFAAEGTRRAIFRAEVDGVVVGMVNLSIFERMPRPGVGASRWCYLANAFVRAEHRNAGIGAALLAEATDHARAIGAERIVLAPSQRSVSFYERAGFGPATMLMAKPL